MPNLQDMTLPGRKAKDIEIVGLDYVVSVGPSCYEEAVLFDSPLIEQRPSFWVRYAFHLGELA